MTLGAFTGVAAADAAKDAEVEVALTGVFELPKAAAAVAQGALAYWDGSKVVASGGESDVLIRFARRAREHEQRLWGLQEA